MTLILRRQYLVGPQDLTIARHKSSHLVPQLHGTPMQCMKHSYENDDRARSGADRRACTFL